MSLTKTNRFVLAAVGIAVALAFFAAVTAVPAQAQTTEELQAQIAALLAQIQALQSQIGGTSAPAGVCSFTRSLTVGSSGADVTCLQNYLMSTGHFTFAGGATGYFGPVTQSAVAAWQAANGVTPAAGYFGPISQAKYNMIAGGTPGTPGTGTPSQCPAGYTMVPLQPAGFQCVVAGGTPTPTPGTLQGTGSGSVAEYQKSSTWVNEEVGEEEDDVVIVGLEIEAETTSDLEILALKVDFDQSTGATLDIDKYADDVSVWFNGKEYGRTDASGFTDDNGFNRTITLDPGLMVEAGERITVQVAVSGVNNLDTTEAGDLWNVDIESVRWRDWQGTVIAEDPSISETQHSYETFATSADVEFKILGNDRDDLNDGHLIDVHATEATDNVEVFSFDVQVLGNSDVELDDLIVEATVTGAANLDDMVDQLHLYVDGDKVDSVTVPTNDETVTFDDLNLNLDAGQTYEVVVAVDFLALSGNLDEADTLLFTIGETETDAATFDVRDANGDALSDADKTGSVVSTASAAFDTGIQLAFVSASATNYPDGAGGTDDDYAIFQMVFDITSFGGTVFVGDTSDATTAANTVIDDVDQLVTDAILYRVYDSGSATVDDLSDTITFTTGSGASDSTDNIQINEGATSRVTLSVQKTGDEHAGEDGIYYMDLAAVAWGVADDTTYENLYFYDLSDFKTTTVAMD